METPEELRQELLKQKGIRVSQRTVERAVQPWREALRQSAKATLRYETRPGTQRQADFWGGIPEQVLVDNAKALIILFLCHDDGELHCFGRELFLIDVSFPGAAD